MGRKNYQVVRLFVLFAFLFAACEKDTVRTTPSTQPPTGSTQRNVFVVCEGTLGNGNSSLHLYTPGQNLVYNDVYKQANSELLGDVFQSMTRIDKRLFLCVNNSDKIVVLNLSDRKKVGEINVSKPRYIVSASSTKAYVSSIFSDKVHIINPQTLSVVGEITMPYKNPEGMILVNGLLYVCCWDTNANNIYAIDINTDKIVKAIPIAGKAPHDISIDRDGKIWVLAGNAPKKIWATLTRIETLSSQIMKSYSFPPLAEPMRIAFNQSRDKFYFIEVDYNGSTQYNGVYTMGIYDDKIPTTPFVAAAQFQYYWALGVDPTNDDVYIGDPKGFVQKGSVSVYREDGTKKSSFDVGIGPGQFYFEN
ncbi:MAG: hypothetical protein R2800_05805 [Flavipsychrobacter sp.]